MHDAALDLAGTVGRADCHNSNCACAAAECLVEYLHGVVALPRQGLLPHDICICPHRSVRRLVAHGKGVISSWRDHPCQPPLPIITLWPSGSSHNCESSRGKFSLQVSLVHLCGRGRSTRQGLKFRQRRGISRDERAAQALQVEVLERNVPVVIFPVCDPTLALESRLLRAELQVRHDVAVTGSTCTLVGTTPSIRQIQRLPEC